MLFNSWEFLVFFPITTILFFFTPHKVRWMVLLLASSVFYCYFIPAYILILFFTIAVDYAAGIFIETSERHKRSWLIASIVANAGLLAVFKYYNFFIQNFNSVTQSHAPFLNMILPIGLSFHTFQAMSYTIEVYRGRQKAERHLGLYALYVMFYPQLVAGPIERPYHMFPQFRKKQYFNWDNLMNGLRLILWGFFKKVVIADRLSPYVDTVFKAPADQHFLVLWCGVLFFTIQIYCDFSGYTDIAIGCAKVIGFDLMLNFNRPYFATSLHEFWKRWHISLSTWFRDYIYIPLGGNRKGIRRQYFNLLIAFILSGFWHGAQWTFIIWGLIHGLSRIAEINIHRKTGTGNNFVGYILTMGVVVLGFVFFRASSTGSALLIIKQMFSFKTGVSLAPISKIPVNNLSFSKIVLAFTFLSIVFMFLVEKFSDPRMFSLNRKRYGDIIFCVLVIFLIMFTGFFNKNPFIYFQF